MQEPDDTEMADLLTGLRFKAPALEDLWAPERTSRRVTPSRIAIVLAVAAVLLVSAGAVAATTGWFNVLQPNGECSKGDPTCGSDYTQAAIAVNHVSNVTMVDVLVKKGFSQARLGEIAAEVAKKNADHRVIVYLFDDLPPGPMNASFAGTPGDDSVPALAPPASLAPYWLLTYDLGPSGVRETHP
jgi:hypothetical protein